jgi:hypothetical protein
MKLKEFLKQMPLFHRLFLEEQAGKEKQKDEYYKKFSEELDKHPIGYKVNR